MTSARLLVVEDEALFARAVVRRLERDGYAVTHAATLADARAALGRVVPDAVLLDMRLPDGSGMALLDELGALAPAPPVLVMTAFAGLDNAVAAMRAGASDYITKPLDLDALSQRIEALLAEATATGNGGGHAPMAPAQETSLTPTLTPTPMRGLLGDSDAIRSLRAEVMRIAALAAGAGTPPTVLLLGETGTGKDVVARSLHASSARSARPFIHVDCAALPKGVIEAELFGHARGAFTGAHSARVGLIEAAGDGTLFLDEVGELPLDVQSRLLAVLERRRLRRVGATDETTVAAWFVAATNRDLPAMVRDGSFRADLYYRLDVMPLRLPPLRDRGDDVALLARHYLGQRSHKTLPRGALSALQAHPWPGNVRELVNVMERAAMSEGEEISEAALGLVRETNAVTDDPTATCAQLPSATLAGNERALIEQALATTGGNVSAAARRLGVSRMTLRYRLEKYGIGPGTGRR